MVLRDFTHLQKFEFHSEMASLPVDDIVDMLIRFGQLVDVKMTFYYVLKNDMT